MDTFKKGLTGGFLMFLITILWMYFEKKMGWHGDAIDEHALFTNIYDLILLLFFAICFKLERNKNTYFKFKNAFIFGLTITATLVILRPLVQFIIHRIISPSYFKNMIEHAVGNGFLDRDSAVANFNLTSYIFQNMIGTAIIGIVLSLLCAFMFKRAKVS